MHLELETLKFLKGKTNLIRIKLKVSILMVGALEDMDSSITVITDSSMMMEDVVK